MSKTIIKQAHIVNENQIKVADILINNDIIEKIDPNISVSHAHEIIAEGEYVFPGMIDDQVHFREPGLTHKASIYTESRAAVAGGITSYMEMPNTIPNTLTLDLLEQKYLIASKQSLANYSFFMGINQNNLEEALKIDNENICGITDDGLYFNDDHGILANYPEFLEKLFSQCDTLIALHCEDDNIIKQNYRQYREQFGDNIPMHYHPLIRSHEACFKASERVVSLAKKHGNRLHIFHVTTAEETNLFDKNTPVSEKKITAEACIPHLWFNDQDYHQLGSYIKWNPSVKTPSDQMALINALNNNSLDIIATDHAPHIALEKNGTYEQAMSGGPMVQHALVALLELYHRQLISLEKIAEKTAHHVAEIYKIQKRGYIREGYYADLAIVNLHQPWQVSPQNILYKCHWSPLSLTTFKSKITHTLVNGKIVYQDGKIVSNHQGSRLKFSKNRI